MIQPKSGTRVNSGGSKLLDKSFFILDETVAKTATKLTVDGLVSLSSEYVNKRLKQIDHKDNAFRDKTNIQTSVKKSSDYPANNPTRIFAEFMEYQGLDGDGLVPCRYQVVPEGFGTWTAGTDSSIAGQSHDSSQAD